MPWLVPPVVLLALALAVLAVRAQRREAAALGVAEEGVQRLHRSTRRLERRLDFLARRSEGEPAEAVGPQGDGAAAVPTPTPRPRPRAVPEPRPPAPS